MFGIKIRNKPEVWNVENTDEFFSYNSNFITDGKVYIKGNKKLEFRVSNSSFVYIPKKNILFIKKGDKNMLNRAILMGRLVSDPELKTTASNVSVSSFRIAVDRSYVKSGEERKADFIDIVCWRHTAEFVCRYFSKGSLIAVEGQLQSRTYQAKDGTNRYVVEVVADSVHFTGERKDGANNKQTPSQSQQNYAPQQQNYQQEQDFYDELPADDDLPFCAPRS